jgi:hypothetical protein
LIKHTDVIAFSIILIADLGYKKIIFKKIAEQRAFNIKQSFKILGIHSTVKLLGVGIYESNISIG